MKIIQLSDLHIRKESTYDQYSLKVERIVSTIKSYVNKDELILFIVCGDIIDQGDPSGYLLATEIFNYIQNELSQYNLSFEFVPGNHEIDRTLSLNFDEFGKFVNQFNPNSVNSANKDIFVRSYDGVSFVLMNSCYHKNTSYGKLNLENLSTIEKELDGPTVWVAHHTIFSKYPDDASSIRDSHALIRHISNIKSIAYIHGHTHGYSDVTVGKTCKVIGVGPLFKSIEDVNNQFNILSILGTQLVKIDNFCYRADTNTFTKQTLFENTKSNRYEGTSLKDVYNTSLVNVKARSVVNNFHLNLTCSTDNFKHEIEKEFPAQIIIAKQWIEDDLPDEMYYNHAQFMNKAGIKGIEYVINELSSKSTSSRAIIPLINMDDVVSSGDNYLPSLDIIQFGFDNEQKTKIYLTIYLRALEVHHFLKINLSEMYHLINSICEKFRSVCSLELNIIAFRAQYKETFGCFRKARIDSINPHKMSMIISKKKIDEIIIMLEEKKSLSETVINADGIKSLLAALNENIEYDNYEFYNHQIINESILLVKLHEELIEKRKRTSLHSEIEKIEQKILDSMDNIIQYLTAIKE